jgi:death-on-curing protein
MAEIEFLSLDDVLAIHADQLARYGGRAGFVDRNVVEGVTAAPQATMFGSYLNEDIAAMAAAYLFSFAASQGFTDGNKRTAAACAIEFLLRNGYDLNVTNDQLYETTMSVANHQLDKDGVADWIRENLESIP